MSDRDASQFFTKEFFGMAIDVIAEMEAEQKRAAARSSGSNVSWFMLKDGEKSLIRCLLNLSQAAIILKHDFYNPATRKFEVNALCARSLDLDEEQCAHCIAARGNKKLLAQKYFILPVYVYGVKNSSGQAVVYTDSEGNEKAVQGLKYLQLKASSDILAVLLAMYRDGTNLTGLDLKISRTGASTDTKYTVLPQSPSPFAVADVPVQNVEDIITRIADLNPPAIAGGLPTPPPAVSSAAPAKAVVPDF